MRSQFVRSVVAVVGAALVVLLVVGYGASVYAQPEASPVSADTPEAAQQGTGLQVASANYPVGLVGTIPHPNGYHPVSVYANVPQSVIDPHSTFFSERFVHVAPAMNGKFYDPMMKQFGCFVEFRPEFPLLRDLAIQGEISRRIENVPRRDGLSPPWLINPLPPVGYVISLRLVGQEPVVLQRRLYSDNSSIEGRFSVVAKNVEMADVQNASLEVVLLYEHKGMAASGVRIAQVVSLASEAIQEVLGKPTGEDLTGKAFFVTRDVSAEITTIFNRSVRLIILDDPTAEALVASLDSLSQVNSFFPEKTLRDLKEEAELFVFYTKDMGRVDLSAHTLDQILSESETRDIVSYKTREVSDALYEIAERTNDWKKFFNEVKSESIRTHGGGGSFSYGSLSFGAKYQSAFSKKDSELTAEEESAVKDFYEKSINKTLSESDFNTERYEKIIGVMRSSKNAAKEIVLHHVDSTRMTQNLNADIVKMRSGGILLKTCGYSISLSDVEAESFLGNRFTALQEEYGVFKEDFAVFKEEMDRRAEKIRVPTGTISAYWGKEAPDGWAICDGSLIPNEPKYRDIREHMLKELGGTEPRFPDLRGMFLRGLNNMGTPAGARTGAYADPQPARALGAEQGSAFASHNHGGTIQANGAHIHGGGSLVRQSGKEGTPSHVVEGRHANWGGRHEDTEIVPNIVYDMAPDGGHTHTFTITPTGSGNETRPNNIAVLYIIKL